MRPNFAQFRQANLPLVEAEMSHFISTYTENSMLKEAMMYSIEAGGKRFRPLLLLATIAAFESELRSDAYQAAAALEMIHTYSLIHDDLPAMDDDDLRRGKPTNHKVFGEAYAILAGDGLLTAAFQLLAMSSIENEKKIHLIQLLSQSSGIQGMVAGQASDIQGEEKELSLDELMEIHTKKTGALIEFATVSGGILANQQPKTVELLKSFAKHLGLAFQIRDDILDVISSEKELGKKVRRDEALYKSTYPKFFGLEGAKKELESELSIGSELLEKIKIENHLFQPIYLKELIEQLRL